MPTFFCCQSLTQKSGRHHAATTRTSSCILRRKYTEDKRALPLSFTRPRYCCWVTPLSRLTTYRRAAISRGIHHRRIRHIQLFFQLLLLVDTNSVALLGYSKLALRSSTTGGESFSESDNITILSVPVSNVFRRSRPNHQAAWRRTVFNIRQRRENFSRCSISLTKNTKYGCCVLVKYAQNALSVKYHIVSVSDGNLPAVSGHQCRYIRQGVNRIGTSRSDLRA